MECDNSAPVASPQPAPVLAYASLAGEQIPAATLENVHMLRQAAEYRGGRRALVNSGIFDLCMGLLAIAAASFLGGFALSTFTVCLLATGTIVTGMGIWKILDPSPRGMLVGGVVYIVLSVCIFGLLVLEHRGFDDGGAGNLIVFVVSGIGSIFYSRRYAAAASLHPSRELVHWLDETARSIRFADPESDRKLVAFTSIIGFGSKWKARLLDELGIFVGDPGKAGHGLLFLTRDEIVIDPCGKCLLSQNLKARITLGTWTGTCAISPASLDRFQFWKSGGVIRVPASAGSDLARRISAMMNR
jgi:hypothetical protein